MIRVGPDYGLENQADEILWTDRRKHGENKHGTIFGILSEEQLQLRLEREVYSASGLPIDVANASGLYRRAWSSRLINDRPTGRNLSRRADPWMQNHHESSGDEVAKAYLPNVLREEVTGGTHYTSGISRDPRWAVVQMPHYHLDRYQRCRIRAALRRGRLVEGLAKHYGVPVVAIE